MKYDQHYTEYQLEKRSWLRSIIRDLYLNNIHKYVLGAAIDLGCGVGELLKKLPPNSMGLEINKSTVEYCIANNLKVSLYNPLKDQYKFSEIPENKFKSLVMSHVLEHLEDPLNAFKQVLDSCNRLGIDRIIVVVPGKKGFEFDSTHVEYIDPLFFKRNNLLNYRDYNITKLQYFPVNLKFFGNLFIYNEMIVMYDRKDV